MPAWVERLKQEIVLFAYSQLEQAVFLCEEDTHTVCASFQFLSGLMQGRGWCVQKGSSLKFPLDTSLPSCPVPKKCSAKVLEMSQCVKGRDAKVGGKKLGKRHGEERDSPHLVLGGKGIM